MVKYFWKKVEISCNGTVFAALELKLDIIESSEQQLEKLKHEYSELLRKLERTDPNEINRLKRIDDLTK